MKLPILGLAAGMICASVAGAAWASDSSHGDSQASSHSGTQSGTKTASGPVHWSYSGADGPENWGNLSTDYEMCRSGTQQSPVDISHTQQAGLAAIDTDYRATALNVVNNGHTIQVNYAPGSRMILGHSEYELLQFHFHAPSENTLNGKHFDMEIHFVHKDSHGVLGVLGVFVESGDENIALQEIWDHMPKRANSDAKPSGVVINGHDLLPREQDYYRFVGSLTTPPCSEGVQWHVLQQPIQASSSQIRDFVDVVGHNNRPVQSLGHRLMVDSAVSGGGGSH